MSKAKSPMVQSPMEQALSAARAAAARGEVPVGAVLVDGATGGVMAVAGNRTRELADPTAHAEMLVLREAAAKPGATRLFGCDLYVTLEPCAMCAGAISLARVRRLYFAAYDPKSGGVEHGGRLVGRWLRGRQLLYSRTHHHWPPSHSLIISLIVVDQFIYPTVLEHLDGRRGGGTLPGWKLESIVSHRSKLGHRPPRCSRQ